LVWDRERRDRERRDRERRDREKRDRERKGVVCIMALILLGGKRGRKGKKIWLHVFKL